MAVESPMGLHCRCLLATATGLDPMKVPALGSGVSEARWGLEACLGELIVVGGLSSQTYDGLLSLTMNAFSWTKGSRLHIIVQISTTHQASIPQQRPC